MDESSEKWNSLTEGKRGRTAEVTALEIGDGFGSNR